MILCSIHLGEAVLFSMIIYQFFLKWPSVQTTLKVRLLGAILSCLY